MLTSICTDKTALINSQASLFMRLDIYWKFETNDLADLAKTAAGKRNDLITIL